MADCACKRYSTAPAKAVANAIAFADFDPGHGSHVGLLGLRDVVRRLEYGIRPTDIIISESDPVHSRHLEKIFHDQLKLPVRIRARERVENTLRDYLDGPIGSGFFDFEGHAPPPDVMNGLLSPLTALIHPEKCWLQFTYSYPARAQYKKYTEMYFDVAADAMRHFDLNLRVGIETLTHPAFYLWVLLQRAMPHCKLIGRTQSYQDRCKYLMSTTWFSVEPNEDGLTGIQSAGQHIINSIIVDSPIKGKYMALDPTARAYTLLEEGKSSHEVAKLTGLSVPSVAAIRANLTRRNQPKVFRVEGSWLVEATTREEAEAIISTRRSKGVRVLSSEMSSTRIPASQMTEA